MKNENIQKILSYQISTKALNKVLMIIGVFISSFLFVWNAEAIALTSNNIVPFLDWSKTEYFWHAYFTLAVIWGFLYLLTGNLFVSFMIMEVSTLILGIANRITLVTRKQFISAADLKVAKEAADVDVDILSVYDPIWVVLIIIGLIMSLLFIFAYCKNRNKDKKNRKKILVARVCGLLVLAGIYVYAYAIRPTEILLYELNAFMKTGNVVWLCQSFFNGPVQDVPLEDVLEMYDEYELLVEEEEEFSTKRPNVIVVMSEAFWDTENLEGIVELSENPIDAYNELMEEKNAITGQIAVNIYGGGTNTTEFEFLTGLNAMNFTDITDVYREFYGRPQESMVSYMEELGYYTMAFHPYIGEFWGRDMAYPNMGFNEFYTNDKFKNTEMCHGYISDRSLTREIIDRFNEQKERNPQQPIFSFSVSVQNHVNDLGEFDLATGKQGCTGISATVKDRQPDEMTQANLHEYYGGLRETIAALEELITYFENYEEDTMIVFFGDHAPLFVNLICETEGKENDMNLYRTPYMVWTNYENDYVSYGDMNISYFSSILIEYLDLPRPKQYYINKYMQENYPINTKFEQWQAEDVNTDRLLDSLSIAYYVYNHFPEEDNALPFWQITKK